MSAKPGTGDRAATTPIPAGLESTARFPVRRVLIRAQKGWRLPDLREAWSYRELFWVLALRDIKIRYKQTMLGVAWAIVQPFFTMIIFTAISHLANISTDGSRPEVFYYCGMLPWLLFANSVTSAGNSLLGSQHLITKVYFPRLIVPVASVITGFVDFSIAFLALLVLMLWYHVAPGSQIVFLPAVVVLAVLAALGFGIWLSALNVQFRDVRHVVPFVIQIALFCTPILYSSTSVHSGWRRTLLGLNPMSGVVEGFRWCLLGRPTPGPTLALSSLTVVVVLVTSLWYFQRVERTLADRL